jgi:hypothetical protein
MMDASQEGTVSAMMLMGVSVGLRAFVDGGIGGADVREWHDAYRFTIAGGLCHIVDEGQAERFPERVRCLDRLLPENHAKAWTALLWAGTTGLSLDRLEGNGRSKDEFGIVMHGNGVAETDVGRHLLVTGDDHDANWASDDLL